MKNTLPKDKSDWGKKGIWGLGYKIVSKFLPSYITYMVRSDPKFESIFKMYYDEKEPYIHKSEYLKNAKLLGNKNTGLIGNQTNNILIGNSGNNIINGKEGIDIVQFTGVLDDQKIELNNNTVITEDKLIRDGKDTFNI